MESCKDHRRTFQNHKVPLRLPRYVPTPGRLTHGRRDVMAWEGKRQRHILSAVQQQQQGHRQAGPKEEHIRSNNSEFRLDISATVWFPRAISPKTLLMLHRWECYRFLTSQLARTKKFIFTAFLVRCWYFNVNDSTASFMVSQKKIIRIAPSALS